MKNKWTPKQFLVGYVIAIAVDFAIQYWLIRKEEQILEYKINLQPVGGKQS